ncbi:TIGR03943 family putative permease subunit [Parasphingorhabdus pacifica]
MRRETQNVLLVLLGGALLKLALTGAYLRYVKPSLLPWLVVAGVVMVLLAAFAIAHDIRRAGRDANAIGDAAGEPECAGHEHGSRSPWMLLLPVFAVFLVAPPALGSDSVRRAGDVVSTPERSGSGAMFEELPQDGIPLLSVSEFVTRAVWGDDGVIEERPVRLQGFVVPPETPGAPVRLARMRISCCAADASPVRVDLAGRAAARIAELPADTWIEAVGTLRAGTATEANGQVPTFELVRARTIPVPSKQYEY